MCKLLKFLKVNLEKPLEGKKQFSMSYVKLHRMSSSKNVVIVRTALESVNPRVFKLLAVCIHTHLCWPFFKTSHTVITGTLKCPGME